MDRHPLTSRYAEPELERRFLLASLPPNVDRPIGITDRYIRGTQLRLRKMEDLGGTAPSVFKLAQKVRPDPTDPTRVVLTNLYITPEEYDLLRSHPADVLQKTRYRLETPGRYLSVNVFQGPLHGLIMLEADFASDEDMEAFSPPDLVRCEVSLDDRFSGGRLARASADDLEAWLDELMRRT